MSEMHIVQNQFVRPVTERDIARINRSTGWVRHRLGVAVLDHLVSVEHFLDPAPRGKRVRHLPDHEPDELDRHGHQRQEVRHGHDVSSADGARSQPERPSDHNRNSDDRRQRLDDRPIADPHAVDTDQLVAKIVSGLGEPIRLILTTPERP